jgi:hypothetical protein
MLVLLSEEQFGAHDEHHGDGQHDETHHDALPAFFDPHLRLPRTPEPIHARRPVDGKVLGLEARKVSGLRKTGESRND